MFIKPLSIYRWTGIIFALVNVVVLLTQIWTLFPVSPKCNEEMQLYLLPLRLIILVNSKNNHFEKRMAVRETWGNRTLIESFAGTGFVRGPFFVIDKSEEGLSANETQRLEGEKKQFNDILEVNKPEDYNRLTPKILEAFKWVEKQIEKWKKEDNHLSSQDDSYYIWKTDDDVYIHLYRIIKIFYNDFRMYQTRNILFDKTFYCHLIPHGKVRGGNRRHLDVTFSITRQDYCSGIVIVFDSKMLPSIINTSNSMVESIVDDSFFTDLVAEKLAIQGKQIPNEKYQDVTSWDPQTLCNAGTGTKGEWRLILHHVTESQMKLIHQCFLKCWKIENEIEV